MYRLLSSSRSFCGVAVVLVVLIVAGFVGTVGVGIGIGAVAVTVTIIVLVAVAIIILVAVAIGVLVTIRFLPDSVFALTALDLVAAAHHVVDCRCVFVAVLFPFAIASPMGFVESMCPTIFVTKACE